jgi:hypothetical protein
VKELALEALRVSKVKTIQRKGYNYPSHGDFILGRAS